MTIQQKAVPIGTAFCITMTNKVPETSDETEITEKYGSSLKIVYFYRTNQLQNNYEKKIKRQRTHKSFPRINKIFIELSRVFVTFAYNCKPNYNTYVPFKI